MTSAHTPAAASLTAPADEADMASACARPVIVPGARGDEFALPSLILPRADTRCCCPPNVRMSVIQRRLSEDKKWHVDRTGRQQCH